MPNSFRRIRRQMQHLICDFNTWIPTARCIVHTIDLVDLPQHRVWYPSHHSRTRWSTSVHAVD
ncbi:MAG: hypothetical protein ACKO83_12795 [Roseiflexaceae bacterium]